MKTKMKPDLTLGDFIMSAHQAWGAGRADRVLRFMIETRFVVFREPTLCLIASAKERLV
jgi:hypothetical protein